MKNQNGITMVMLVTIVIVLIILASITVVSSIQSYREMKFNTFKSTLKEIQGKVDEICEDYKLQEGTYTEYFTKVYGSSPSLIESVNTEKVNNIKTTYAEYISGHDGYVFYFNSEDIKKYLDLSGIEDEFVIDFSTRYVFSVNGCKNPDDTSEYYHFAIEYGANIIQEDKTSKKSSLNSVTAAGEVKQVGNTYMLPVTLNVSYGTEGTKYPVEKVYYSKDNGATWIGVKDYKENSEGYENRVDIEFVLYDVGTYMFKVEDSSGWNVSSGTLEFSK